MKIKIYNFLVNRHIGICYRYHQFHNNSSGLKKIISWLYLLWLNFAYYFLFMHFLGKNPCADYYENVRLSSDKPESYVNIYKGFKEQIDKHDVISFDIFDTLVFRPFSEPTALFYLLEKEIGIMNFHNIRVAMEHEARQLHYRRFGNYETDFSEIWEMIEKCIGTEVKAGAIIEQNLELQLCYANEDMLSFYKYAIDTGKTVIITSDMYFSGEFISRLLNKCGYSGWHRMFISSEYQNNKYSGGIYDLIHSEYKDKSILHIGDNIRSDVKNAISHGIASFHIPNTDISGGKFRARDMSAIIGSAYRGVVNHVIYAGSTLKSMDYEFGYIYGGLFVLGYCNFIHNYCELHNIDKILFLSRDGDIIKQAYDFLYPDANTEYVYWSRKAATKLMAQADRYDFFRRFLYHKVNQNIKLSDVFISMNLDCLFEESGFGEDEYLTDKNAGSVKKYLDERWEDVLALYETEHKSARTYYGKVLENCSSAVAVDIGWAGSGAVSLDYLVRNVWNIPCSITGIIAGTNTIHNAEPDASETFLLSGRLVSYMYSQSHNRDLLKKHDPNKDYNVYWEILLSSPTRQFSGFGLNEDGSVRLDFGKADANRDGIMDIQRGILDFVKEYYSHFKNFPYMFNISGRDAYAPMLVAAGHNEKYLKAVKKRFDLNININ